MAKSQYTDSITGNILADIRVVNDKIINFGNYIPYKYTNQNSLTSTSKYSNKGFYPNGNSLDVYYGSSYSLINKFTLSWWENIITKGTTEWTGMCIDSPTIRYHFMILAYNTSEGRISIAQYTPSWNSLSFVTSGSVPSLNTWYHYAVIFDGSNYKMYRNGSLILTANYSSAIGNLNRIWVQKGTGNDAIYDDIVLINNQVLWTGNFIPPDYLLTGDKDIPRKLRSRMQYYPTNKSGDYFDQAYLY